MKEKFLTDKIKDYLKSVDGLFFFKEHGGQFGTGGIPDLIVCYGIRTARPNGSQTGGIPDLIVCYGIRTARPNGSQTGGIPDLIVCYGGRFIAFEVKGENGKPTLLQEITIQQIKKAGGTAMVVRSLEEVKAVIESLKG